MTDYINTGHWSEAAIAEARRYCAVNVAGDAGGEYLRVPPQRELKLSTEARLPALHAERDDQRRRVRLRAR